MVKQNRISVRAGASYDRLKTIAAVLDTEACTVSVSDIVRTLLAEAVTARTRDCARQHKGPVRASACGHCGRPV